MGQVAHVDVPSNRHGPDVWQRALNARLPAAIRILRCQSVPASFHAQRAAKRKTYLYRVWLGQSLHPLEINRAWHFPWPIAMAPLRRGAERLTGCCLLVRREVLQKVGAFDERYGIGFFEDDDWCIRAREAGFELLVALNVFIHHFGSRTFAGLAIDCQK